MDGTPQVSEKLKKEGFGERTVRIYAATSQVGCVLVPEHLCWCTDSLGDQAWCRGYYPRGPSEYLTRNSPPEGQTYWLEAGEGGRSVPCKAGFRRRRRESSSRYQEGQV